MVSATRAASPSDRHRVMVTTIDVGELPSGQSGSAGVCEPPSSLQLRLVLAVLSLGTAAIHFAVLGEHFAEYVPFGLFFACVAWLQAIWAVGIVASPRRWLFGAGMLGNALVIAVWAVSRAWAVPLGPEAGHPHAVGGADLTATALEALIVAGGAVLLWPRGRGRLRGLAGRRWAGAAGAVAVLVMAVVTATIPASRGHHDGESAHGDPQHGDAPHDTQHGDSHHVVSGSGEADPAQIESIRAATARYRDVDVARSEGWEQEDSDWPEFGAHFARAADWSGPLPTHSGLDLSAPDFLMYSRIGRDDWELVAVAYVVDQAGSPRPPTALQGATYHEHAWTCVVAGEELDEEEQGPISPDDCRARHGHWSPGGVWMTHVWLIDNPDGIFAESNPALV